MLLLLLLLLLPTLAVSSCVDWDKCKEATCFSKYNDRNELGIFLGLPAPKTVIALQLEGKATRVSIQLEVEGMLDDDYAAIAVGNRRVGGCHAGVKKLELNTQGPIWMKEPVSPPATPRYSGNAFCCVVDVYNLDVHYLDEPSSKPLSLIYTTGNKKNLVEMPADFTAK
ncbi:hypothetical protein PFISCL1PPCAC_5203, partial [Pristionchus fissidentatus]